MTAVAVLTKDRSHALGWSPADGDTEESRWRARVDSRKNMEEFIASEK